MVKDYELAELHRKSGNACYKQRDFEKALHFYNLSICNCNINQERYIKALGNKSAVQFEAGKFQKAARIIKFVSSLEGHALEEAFVSKLNHRLQECEHHIETHEIYSPRYPNHPYENKKTKLVNSKMGRAIVASDAFAPSETVYCVAPYAAVVGRDKWSSYCYSCFLFNADCVVVPCESCAEVQYCSLECRSEDVIHRNIECISIGQLAKLGMFHLSVRVLLTVSGDAVLAMISPESLKLCDSAKCNLADRELLSLFHDPEMSKALLQDHTEEISTATNILKTSAQFSELNLETVKKMLVTVTSQMINNASTIVHLSTNDVSSTPIGSGIYPKIALMNHSCYSNTVCLFKGKVATVQAAREIPATDELFNCYGFDFENSERKTRQENLEMQYGFVCQCAACASNWERDNTVRNVKCQKCSETIFIGLSTTTCSLCSASISDTLEQLQTLEENYSAAYALYQEKDYSAAYPILADNNKLQLLKLPDALLLDWNDLLKKTIIYLYINKK